MVAPVPDQLPNLPSSFTHSTSPQFSSTFPRMLTPFLLITYMQTKYFHAVTHSFAQRRAAIPFIPKSLRTLSIATGVYPETSLTTALQASKPTNAFVYISLPPLCALFSLFSAFVSFVFNGLQPLFPKYRGYGYSGPIGGLSAGVDEDSRCRRRFCGTPGWGYPDPSEGHASRNISKASLVSQRKYLPGAHCKPCLLECPVREGEVSP